MVTVGALEAEAQLSSLLDRVSRGEEVVITRGGEPVARLVPPVQDDPVRAEEIVQAMRQLREGVRLDGLSVQELRDEGRR